MMFDITENKKLDFPIFNSYPKILKIAEKNKTILFSKDNNIKKKALKI